MKKGKGTERTGKRFAVLTAVLLTVTALFTARLIQWQIVQSGMYDESYSERETYTITGSPVRGEIYDRNGEPLAVNLTGYRIVMNKLFLNNDKLNDIIVSLTELIEKCGEKWKDELPVCIDENGVYQFDEKKQDEVRSLKSRDSLNVNPYASAEECMERLSEMYECDEYSQEQQRKIISVRYNMAKTGYSRSQPYIFAEGLSEGTASVISERMSGEKGVTAEACAVRQYINGDAAPHLVGVTGSISQKEYEQLMDKGYDYNDIVGKSGIEYALEEELRGKAGSRTYEINDSGEAELVSTESAQAGNSVYLTIDIRLQRAAQKALQEAVKDANDFAEQIGDEGSGADCKGGAAVVVKIDDFSVLCAASCPWYDISSFYEDYQKLASDEALPLFDRAFMGALAPGSTFKPLTACAALQEKKITTETMINCEGVYTTGGLSLWCMGYHGEIDVKHALKYSCNVFFAETGRLLGIDKLDEYARRCGLGVKTGVEVAESRGTLAGPEYSELMGSEWYTGSVSPAAIGQSDNQFTPLQLAVYTASIANGGKRLKAHTVDRVVKYSTDETVYKTEAEQVDDMGVSAENLAAVRDGMLFAAGNYISLQDFPIKIGGKTGTAENSGSDHSNFICFAPYDKPEIAVAVMIEHGAKSGAAVTTARKILEAYFEEKLQADEN